MSNIKLLNDTVGNLRNCLSSLLRQYSGRKLEIDQRISVFEIMMS